MRVAASGPGGTFHLQFQNQDKTGPIQIPDTGGWTTYATIQKQVSLTQGTQQMKFMMDQNGSNQFGSGNLNWIRLTQQATPTPTSTPPPTPTSCHQYTPSSPIPAGFGSPYDVLTSPSTNLMAVTCTATNATVTLGKQDPLQYIYNQGYLFKTGGTNWNPISYASTESLIANTWYPKSANTTINLTSTELQNDSYVLSYMCNWTGSAWKCGCRDAACTQRYWQIQSFRR
jgi:Carbohydrate binding module (family 6)